MLKINYSSNFDGKKYYDKISKKRLHTKIKDDDNDKVIREEFQEIEDFLDKKTVTLENIFNKFKELEIDNFHTLFKNISFEELLIGDFEKVQDIKRKIGTNNEITENKSIKFLFDYTGLREKYISPFFEKNLDIYTCYYCNIDYINSYNVAKKKKNKFTLDHYYDKSTYPYLALSLYNFVPSCYACNSKLKRTEEFTNLSPSSKDFDFDKKVKFKLFLSDKCQNLHIRSKDDIEIPLKEKYSDKYQKYIDVFKLNDRYSAHKDIVYEMMKNAELYPESRLKELQELTDIPYQEIKKDIFNLIDDATDLSKKPFSKLIKDISKELGLT